MRCVTFFVCFLCLAAVTGCDQASQFIGGSQPEPAPVNPMPQVQPPAPDPEPVITDHQLTVATDVYGATITVRDAKTSEELHMAKLDRGEQSTECTLPVDSAVIAAVSGYGHTRESQIITLGQDESVEVPLDLLSGAAYRELIKSATCLVKIPDGGFGSGFLYGDRQTIVTAAHCVAAKDVSDLAFTFYPDEAREKTVSGASLIFYDRKQDVAMLHLPEAVSDEHYWLWSTGQANPGDEIFVMGNPGRNGEYDPMYARTCSVAEVRPDELRLDVEIYPGYSGGPVVLDGSTKLLGIISYKIVRSSDYQQVGYSFAKSGDIAADAFENWNSLDSELQQLHVDRVEDRYSREFGRFMASNVASAYYSDSAVYTIICISLITDYRVHMLNTAAALPPMRASVRNIKMRKAHEEFIDDVAPKIAERVRERVSPKLMGLFVDQDHELIMTDVSVNQSVKDDLEKAREAYLVLKEAAETIVKKRGKQDRDAEEFEEYILELWSDARFHASDVLDATAVH